MAPKITVLMAVYNGEAYLRECMESALNQTYKDFEFLIIDDASTDATRTIIKSYKDSRIRLIENGRNLSQVTSLNIGLGYAKGEFIARIDADDAMLPNRLERQLSFLNSRTDVALAGSWAEAMDEKGRTVAIARLPLKNEEIIATILFGEFIMVHSSVMFRKDIILGVGKYNEFFSFTEDLKLIIDLLTKGYKISNIPERLIKYRIHNDRISVRDHALQIKRAYIAIREFLGNFTGELSEIDRGLLFNFLTSAGSMNKLYWENGLSKKDFKKIIALLDLLLVNISGYFKFKKIEDYFMKRIFYNKLLNFGYAGCGLNGRSSAGLYAHCIKNSFFILERPKLYLYPFIAAAPLCFRRK